MSIGGDFSVVLKLATQIPCLYIAVNGNLWVGVGVGKMKQIEISHKKINMYSSSFLPCS